MNIRFKNAIDFRKSLEARLQTISKNKGLDLQRLRRKVAFDRFLARIFSQEQSGFYLKGGYAMELRIAQARATKDIDLTYIGRVKDEAELLNRLIWSDLQTIAQRDLNDHFTYQVSAAEMDLENAPYGGARYPVSSFIDKKLFVRFQLDVGADFLVDKVEFIQGNDWLEFCSIAPPTISMISIEQQFAEKLHTYTLPREDRLNSRAKDLIDMILLLNMHPSNRTGMLHALQAVFQKRDTHSLPKKLIPPPAEWDSQFVKMAVECGISQNMQEHFVRVSDFFDGMNFTFS